MSINTDKDPREGKVHPIPVEGLRKLHIDGPDKVVHIGVTLPEMKIESLTLLLIEFRELFVWKPSDMSGISEEVITHELNIDPSIKPIAQKR